MLKNKQVNRTIKTYAFVLYSADMLTVLDSVEFPAVGPYLDPSLAHVDTARAGFNSGIPLSSNLQYFISSP